MSNLFHRRTSCRLCAGRRLDLVIGLTPTPPANAFVDKTALSSCQASFPLDVFFCNDCAHVQLLDVVDPSTLFKNYVYVSGTSKTFVSHFQDYAADIFARFNLNSDDLVVDIGSNDGTLLKAFKGRGLRVLGIDPAENIAAQANIDGVPTICDFFSRELAKIIDRDHGKACLITANNVFAHADDLVGIVSAVKDLLAADGIFVFEVSYLLDVIEKTLFDTIYHEHLSYHSVIPLQKFFQSNGMELISAKRVESHGGSLRGVVQLAEGPRRPDNSVAELVALERRRKIDKRDTFVSFSSRIQFTKNKLSNLILDYMAADKTIAGFGAPAKATTLLYHFGIDATVIDFIVDDNPLKQGLYSPGMHIPIVPTMKMYEDRPDMVIVLAWNFADSIIANHMAYLDNGACFVIPLPSVCVVTSKESS